jgi:hypothetical protein
MRAATPCSTLVAVGAAVALGSCAGPDAVTNSASDPSAAPDLAAPADLAQPPGDSLPRGAVSFYNRASCPGGWEPLAMAKGRTVVPRVGSDPAGADPAVGEPLGDSEDRPHGHAVSASLDLPAVSYVGIAGEANHGVGRAGKTAVTAAASPVSAGLPYVQLLICHKTAEADPAQRPAPAGLLMFFLLPECPSGWVQAGLSQGRFLVGLPDTGTPGQTFGGPPLAPSEKRAHRHELKGTIKTSSHGIALLSGGGAGGYARDDSHAYQIASEETSATLPYLQLLQCQRR